MIYFHQISLELPTDPCTCGAPLATEANIRATEPSD